MKQTKQIMGVTSGDGLSRDVVVSALLTPDTPFSGDFLLDGSYPHVKFSTRSGHSQSHGTNCTCSRAFSQHFSPLAPQVHTCPCFYLTHDAPQLRFPERKGVFTHGVAPLKPREEGQQLPVAQIRISKTAPANPR